MRKETVLKLLSNICLLIPGNIKSRKGWYLSLYTFTSLIGFALVIFNSSVELIGHKKYAEDRKTSELFQNFTHPPIRPVAFCMKRENAGGIMNSGISESLLPQRNATPPSPAIPSSGNGTQKPAAKREESNYLEDIVATSDKLLALAVNLCVRLFLWFSFPLMIDLFVKLFSSNQQQQENLSGQQNSFMVQLWSESVQLWSPCEKIFLFTIALSQFQRELNLYFQFRWSVGEVGLDFINIPCLIVQVAWAQIITLTSRELVMEVATFFLLVVMKTFVNMLRVVVERDDMKMGRDGVVPIGTGKHSKMFAKVGNLFERTHEMLLTSELKMGDRAHFPYPNKMASIQDHISEVVGVQDYDDEGNHDSSLIFKISQRKQLAAKFSNQEGGKPDSGKDIYSKINFIISMYFELMATWERCSKITGFIALLLFAELTSTFCFNTYLTLDSAMTFGLFSGMGIGGILRGIVIITKFVCVCNTAQILKDMTPILLDRILKLKLRLLSLPPDSCAPKHFSDVESENNMYTTDGSRTGCERCRGLGSFLSEMVSYIRGHPFELSALGYFNVSRSTLTTITGVIVTYLVVLVQFQSYASTKSS